MRLPRVQGWKMNSIVQRERAVTSGVAVLLRRVCKFETRTELLEIKTPQVP